MATEYVVLGLIEHEDGDGWFEHARVEERSAQAAVRSALDGIQEDGTYVAVPARSWKPVTVKVETKTALRFS